MRKILLIIFTFLVTVVFAQQAPLELNNGLVYSGRQVKETGSQPLFQVLFLPIF
jgi:hypothetical protein